MRFFVMGFTAPPTRTEQVYRPMKRTTVTLCSGERVRMLPAWQTDRAYGHRNGRKGPTLRTHREG